ncbi:MAG: 16S rRNA (cytidine(1402)-2'-O)-methyltransferase [Frankia sp.]
MDGSEPAEHGAGPSSGPGRHPGHGLEDASGALVLCGAPIGDATDASPRLAMTLETADIVAAEDTRRVRRLAVRLGVEIGGRVVSYWDGNEVARAADLVDRMRAGARVALVTDAGMPAVSDPGYRVVAAAVAAGLPVTVVPGPSAVTAALAVSGLPTDRWVFEGFLPRKAGERRTRVAELAGERRTVVLLESPRRIAVTLDVIATAFGADRPAVLCRELTKPWEEIVRPDLSALVAWAARGREIRGEITLVVGGSVARPGWATAVGASAAGTMPASAGEATSAGAGGAASAGAGGAVPTSAGGAPRTTTELAAALAAAVAQRESGGMSRKEAIRAVAGESGVRRSAVFDAVAAAKHATGARPA